MNEEPQKEIKPDTIEEATVSKEDSIIRVLSNLGRIEEPLTWEEFLNTDSITTTSGVMSRKEIEGYCDSSEIPGFYGFYNIIDKRKRNFVHRKEDPRSGKIIVYVPGGNEGWTQDDLRQRIWKIQLDKDVFSLWNEVRIGMKREKLEMLFEKKKGLMVSKGEYYMQYHFSDFDCSFNLNNDNKITAISVKRNCPSNKITLTSPQEEKVK